MKRAANAKMQKIATTLRWRLNQLMGKTCVGCTRPCLYALCDNCLQRSLQKPNFACERCGIKISAQSITQHCRACIQQLPLFDALYYVGDYQGLLADLIVRSKIARQAEALEAIRLIISHQPALDKQRLNENTALLAMPIPRLRLMQRGFNLPGLLANQLAKQYQLPLLPSTSVTLPNFTKKQARLSQKQRKNRKIDYNVKKNLPKHIVIVDDVLTTGQTVSQLSKSLKEKGVESVFSWCLARAQWD